MLDPNIRQQLAAHLSRMTRPVELVAVLDDGDAAHELDTLLDELTGLSTSLSRVTVPWHAGQEETSSRLTITSPQASQYQTGMRCPHQIWREMHQSRMFSIQSK